LGDVVTSVVAGAKWVAGGLLTSREAQHEVETCVCLARFCCPRDQPRAELGWVTAHRKREARTQASVENPPGTTGGSRWLCGALVPLALPGERRFLLLEVFAWGKGPLKPPSGREVEALLP